MFKISKHTNCCRISNRNIKCAIFRSSAMKPLPNARGTISGKLLEMRCLFLFKIVTSLVVDLPAIDWNCYPSTGHLTQCKFSQLRKVFDRLSDDRSQAICRRSQNLGLNINECLVAYKKSSQFYYLYREI